MKGPSRERTEDQCVGDNTRVKDSRPVIQHALQRTTGEQSGSSGHRKFQHPGEGAVQPQPEGRKVRRHELDLYLWGSPTESRISHPPESQAQAAKTGCKRRPRQQFGKNFRESPCVAKGKG